jgi:hypothetical protein
VSAGEREVSARGHALRARNVSFAGLPVNQREQTDCSRMSLNPAPPYVAAMFTQLMASQQEVKDSQREVKQSVTEVKASTRSKSVRDGSKSTGHPVHSQPTEC